MNFLAETLKNEIPTPIMHLATIIWYISFAKANQKRERNVTNILKIITFLVLNLSEMLMNKGSSKKNFEAHVLETVKPIIKSSTLNKFFICGRNTEKTTLQDITPRPTRLIAHRACGRFNTKFTPFGFFLYAS